MTALHERIRREIEGQILAGVLEPGDRLPTEQALTVRYGCARMTVSRALSALAAAGLVERRRRAGTVVARPRMHSMILDVPDLPAMVAARGQAYRYDLIGRLIRPADEADIEEAALAGPGALIEIDGVHRADGVPLALEHRLVALRAVPAITDADFAVEPPGSWLLRTVPWTEAETRIAAVAADPRSARRLEIPLGTPCLAVERATWRGGAGITRVRQVFPGDRYDLYARFGPARHDR